MPAAWSTDQISALRLMELYLCGPKSQMHGGSTWALSTGRAQILNGRHVFAVWQLQ